MKFASILNLEGYVEDLMGSTGSQEEAVKLTKYFVEKDYFELKWDGYYPTRKWYNMGDNEFFECWETIGLEAEKQ